MENEKNKDDLTPSDGAESQKDSGTVSPGTVEGDSAIVTPPEGEPPMLESEMGGVSAGGYVHGARNVFSLRNGQGQKAWARSKGMDYCG